jgi:hypothetical protein
MKWRPSPTATYIVGDSRDVLATMSAGSVDVVLSADIVGDSRDVLATMSAGSVDVVLSAPPFPPPPSWPRIWRNHAREPLG